MYSSRYSSRHSFPKSLKTISRNLLSLALLLAVLSSLASAQTLSLELLASDIGEASDYFTDIWGAPRNFSNVCDIGDDDFLYDPESSINGIWQGNNPGAMGPTAKLLPIPQVGAPVVFQEDCHKLAIHRPVDANRFRLLSYRAKFSQPTVSSIRWSKDRGFALNGAPAQQDSISIGNVDLQSPANTWLLKQFDLSAIDTPQFPWAGSITGLALQASFFQAAGGTTSFDWIRLSDPNSSPNIPLRWNLGGKALLDNESVVLYVDTNGQGYDGMSIESVNTTQGTFNFLSASLPAGDYYFYAELRSTDGVNSFPLLRSNYSGPLRINGKPYAKFISPTRTSGQGYSASERRDAWDMEQSSDVANFNAPLGSTQALGRGFSNPRIANGIFIAESDFDPVGASLSVDPQLILPTSRPVDTSRYRYFCHRTQLDTSAIDRSLDLVALNDAGFFARLIYADSTRNLFGSTGGHEMIEKSSVFLDGLVTYCIDLWDAKVHESGTPWTELGSVNVLRFDPLESKDSRLFAVDFAELYQENETEDNSYSINWTTQDPENDTLSLTLYYDSDAEDFNGTQITSLTQQTPGVGNYEWNTSSVPAGEYYIYLEISDGTNLNRLYSEVPVVVSARSGSELTRRAPCDFDADGRSDYSVIRPDFSFKLANWLIRSSSTNATSSLFWGDPNLDIFLDRDSNGDGRSELTVVRKELPLTWFEASTISSATSIVPWGLRGDIPLAVDFDGDQREENVVFRPSDGTWYSILSGGGVLVQQWGLSGDIPVAEDYDGDGISDLAIWRPVNGIWAVSLSTRSYSQTLDDILYVQWGLSGDQPMPGDYTGDGKADLNVWRPSSGLWFVCPSDANFNCSQAAIQQFGLPGDFPIRGDFDGDGTLDYSVYRPSNGNWYVRRSSDAIVDVRQWGQPGDLPMCISPLFTALFS